MSDAGGYALGLWTWVAPGSIPGGNTASRKINMIPARKTPPADILDRPVAATMHGPARRRFDIRETPALANIGLRPEHFHVTTMKVS